MHGHGFMALVLKLAGFEPVAQLSPCSQSSGVYTIRNLRFVTELQFYIIPNYQCLTIGHCGLCMSIVLRAEPQELFNSFFVYF